VKLSVCIPTYNFGAFIAETLESIVCQLTPEVEVVVLDGGSSDDTESVVRDYASRVPAVRYVRQPHRGGIDRDMARSVELALGDYCWLFSADDVMRPRAVQRALHEIESGLDLYLGGLTLCDRAMRVLAEHAVHAAPPGSIFQLADAGQRRRYFGMALTTTAFFSFMGSILVRRSRWLEGSLDEQFVGSCWAHVVRLLRLIPQGLAVKYLGDSLLLKRGENDSFMDRGLVHRYAIAIEGYQRIGQAVFGDASYEARHLRRVIVNEFPPKAFFFAKVQLKRGARESEIAALDRLAALAYRDHSARNVAYRLAYRMTPVWGYEAARAVYKGVRSAARR
jgi:abequosyltransferase